MCMRSSDGEDRTRFRSDRITCENGRFFFSTREGTLEGPYLSREQAEVAAALYIRYRLDPTKCDSMSHKPDPHIYRYNDAVMEERRRDKDRREKDRREKDRRTGDRRG